MTSIRGRFFAALAAIFFGALSYAQAGDWKQCEVLEPKELVGTYMFAGTWTDATPALFKDGKETGYLIVKVKTDFFFRPKAGGTDTPVKLKGVRAGRGTSNYAYAFPVPGGKEPKGVAVPPTTAKEADWRPVQVREGKTIQTLYYDANKLQGGAAPLYARKAAEGTPLGTAARGKDGRLTVTDPKGKDRPIVAVGAEGKIGGAPATATDTLGGERGKTEGARAPGAPSVGESGRVGGQDDLDKDNPVNLLAALLKAQPEAREEVAQRLYSFAKEPPEGRLFFSPELKATLGKEEKLDKALLGVVRTWVERSPADSSEVYFWLCASNPAAKGCSSAAGVLKGGKTESARIASFEKDLGSCLARWSAPAASIQETCGSPSSKVERKPLGGDKQIEWFDAFLADAAEHTRSLLKAERADIKGLFKRVGQVEEAGVEGAVPLGAGNRQLAQGVNASRTFGPEQLFGKWGDYNVMHIDGRRIAVVVRTTKQGDNPPNKFTQEIGIYDISDEGNIYGRRFNMAYDNKASFTLNGKEDGKQYTLKFEPRGNDHVVRLESASPGAKTTYGQTGQTEITVNRLFAERAEKVAKFGSLVEVGGKRYYAFGESSDRGSLTFWAEETINGRAEQGNLDARKLVPEMAAYVNRRSSSGVPENLADKVSLGKVGDQWYDLVWNPQLGIWVPTKGTEPPKEQPKPTDAQGGAQNPTGGTTTAQDGVQVDADGWPVLADPPYKLHKLNEKLDAGLRKTVRFIENTGENNPLQRVSVNLKAGTPKDTLACFVLMPFANGLVARGTEDILGGHIIRVAALYESGKMTRYSDLAGSYDCGNLNAYGDAHFLGDLNKGAIRINVRDWDTQNIAVLDVMKDPEVGFSREAVAGIVTNIEKARAGRKSFEVSGNKTAVVLMFDGKERCKVHPKYEPCGAVSINGPENAPENSVAFDATAGDWNSQDGDLPETTSPEASGPDAKKIKASEDGATALYELKGEDAKDVKYYVLFKVKGSDGISRVGRPILVSKDPGFLKTNPVLSNMLYFGDLKTEKALPVRSTMGVRFAMIPKYREGYEKKGAWALYSSGSEEGQSKYANLHGCFIVWGGAECKK